MDFNSNAVSPNQFPNSMPVPTNMMAQHQQNNEKERLQVFWQKQLSNVQVDEELKSQIPLARIKRIMKPDAQMIGGEVPKLMGKACELFIQELTYRALMQDDGTNKHIVKPSNVAKAILQTHLFDFLTDVLVDYCVSGDKEDDAGCSSEVNQADMPNAAGLMGNPIPQMDMAGDSLVTSQ